MSVPTEHLLILSAILFSIGVAGFFIRRNLIVVLMCIELMLNAANLDMRELTELEDGSHA